MKLIAVTLISLLALLAVAAPADARPRGGSGPAVAFGPPIHGSVTLGPTHNPTGYHSWPAVDFRVPVGTPALAVARGTVVSTGSILTETVGVPGIYLILELARPIGECRYVAYKHLSELTREVGDIVNEGQQVALTGSTAAPRPHLHLDCWRDLATFPNPLGGDTVDWTMRWCNNQAVPKEASPIDLHNGQVLSLNPRGPCR